MARFNIQVRDRTHIREKIEMDAATISEARLEVARFAGEMLLFQADDFWKDRDWQVDVTDENGLILYALQLSVIESAATMSSASN